LVHPVSLNLALLKEPIQVVSSKFKHRDEISEFSFSMEGGDTPTKHGPVNGHHSRASSISKQSIKDPSLGKTSEVDRKALLSP